MAWISKSGRDLGKVFWCLLMVHQFLQVWKQDLTLLQCRNADFCTIGHSNCPYDSLRKLIIFDNNKLSYTPVFVLSASSSGNCVRYTRVSQVLLCLSLPNLRCSEFHYSVWPPGKKSQQHKMIYPPICFRSQSCSWDDSSNQRLDQNDLFQSHSFWRNCLILLPNPIKQKTPDVNNQHSVTTFTLRKKFNRKIANALRISPVFKKNSFLPDFHL